MGERSGPMGGDGRRREGSVRGQTPALGLEAEPVGGVRDEGQRHCHHDSGEGEERGMERGMERDTSPEEAGAPSVLMSAVEPPPDFIRQPAAAECFYHSKVTAAQQEDKQV